MNLRLVCRCLVDSLLCGYLPDSRLEGIIDAMIDLSDNVWGYCYTQLTDVEQEQNGIYFYDRSSKFDMKRIKAIFSKQPKQK